jgi:GT2 family glycosyltransferase
LPDPELQPEVDLVILSWSRVSDTIDAIQSALSQYRVKLHIFIIDQGTPLAEFSNLCNWCQGRNNISLIRNEVNIGVSAGRNQGAALGSAEYLVYLDNDAVFYDERQIATAAAIMSSNSTISALAFRIVSFETGDDEIESWAYGKTRREWASQSFSVHRFVGAGHMLRRSSFENAGGYDSYIFFLHEGNYSPLCGVVTRV